MSASDTLLSMLFSLRLANITILLCFFFLFLVALDNFYFLIPGDMEYASLKFALVIPTGAPIAVANDAVKRLPLVLDKAIKYLSKKMQHIY